MLLAAPPPLLIESCNNFPSPSLMRIRPEVYLVSQRPSSYRIFTVPSGYSRFCKRYKALKKIVENTQFYFTLQELV